MTPIEFLGTASGAAAIPWLGKIAVEWVRRRNRPASTPPAPAYVETNGPKRSFSPTSFAAIVDEKAAARDSLRESVEQTGLLRQVVEGLGRLADRLDEHRDHLVEHVDSAAKRIIEDSQKTRHTVRSDVQAVRLELAVALGQPPPRQRLPSRPGGE